MKPRLLSIVLCVALLLLAPGTTRAAGAGDKTDQPQKPLSNTRHASCLLKITWDPETLPLDEDSFRLLAYRSGVRQRAAWDVFEERKDFFASESIIAPVPRPSIVQVDFDFSRSRVDPEQGMLLAHLEVVIPLEAADLKPAAEELMAATCTRLRAVLLKAHHSEFRQVHEHAELAQREQAEAEKQLVHLQELRRALCAQAGRSGLSREAILDQMRDLEDHKRETEMELAGQQALRRALEEQIARIGERLETETKGDAVLAELEKVVELRNQQLDRFRELVAQGQASPAELADVQGQVAMAKVELAEQRRAAMERLGADRLAELNEELARVSIHAAELEARLHFIAQRLEQMETKNLLELADRFEREVSVQLPMAIEAVESAAAWRRELERQIRVARPPTVTVIGGAEEPSAK